MLMIMQYTIQPTENVSLISPALAWSKFTGYGLQIQFVLAKSQITGTVALNVVWLGQLGPRHAICKSCFLSDKLSNHNSALEVGKATPQDI